MKLTIKGATIIDRNSRHHGKKRDIVLDRGKINVETGKSAGGDEVIEARGMYLTPGWCDMRSWLADPGFEHKEDLSSGLDAAMAGGFTAVAVLPNNEPVTQTKNDIAYLNKYSHPITEVLPYAAVTRNTEGTELTEMIDLHAAGAVAFTDGIQPIWHSDILLKSLQYLQKFNGLLINIAEDRNLNHFGAMHEGVQSTMLGLKGMPAIAEELMIRRDVELLKYAGGRIHFTTVSTAGSVRLIKAARKKGLNVTCDMAVYQCLFDDEALAGFDTVLKVKPPFRGKKDRNALIKALQEDTIDVLVSNHIPQDEESKKLEFDLADFGMISLQTVAANLVSLADKVPMEQLLDKVSVRPRELLQTGVPVIEDGEPINLTLFDPQAEWILDAETNYSKSVNSPFWKNTLKGRVVLTARGSNIHRI